MRHLDAVEAVGAERAHRTLVWVQECWVGSELRRLEAVFGVYSKMSFAKVKFTEASAAAALWWLEQALAVESVCWNRQ